MMRAEAIDWLTSAMIGNAAFKHDVSEQKQTEQLDICGTELTEHYTAAAKDMTASGAVNI